MEIQSLGHVVLKVRDFEKSVPFYTDVLGLKEVARSGNRMVFFTFDNNHHDIALLQTGADAPEAPEKAPGLAHVAFKIGTTLEELRGAKTWLESQGVEIERTADHDVSKSVYFRDPDGNQLEVFIDGDPKTWQEDPQRVAGSAPLEL
ncbi:MAG: VOC family protein [Alphaproteobacteria bacterium]|nr:VOC family protein [Alphaproteobacteria bacterium]